jgi:hypothetical protein
VSIDDEDDNGDGGGGDGAGGGSDGVGFGCYQLRRVRILRYSYLLNY